MEDFFVELGHAGAGGGGGVVHGVEVVFGVQRGEDGVTVWGVLALAGDVGETAADGVSAPAQGAFGAGGEIGGVDGGGVVGGAGVAGETTEGVDRFVVDVDVDVGLGGTGCLLVLFVKTVMYMSSWVKDHFDDGNHENSSQCNGSGHGGVLFRPKAVETLVAERDECGWQKMDKSCGDQDPGTKMTDAEEEHWWETDRGKAGHENGKGACEEGYAKDDGESGAVEGRIVKRLVGNAALGTS